MTSDDADICAVCLERACSVAAEGLFFPLILYSLRSGTHFLSRGLVVVTEFSIALRLSAAVFCAFTKIDYK